MNKTLFNENETLKKEEYQILDKINKALKPIFDEYLEKGFSTREIGKIIIEQMSIIEVQYRSRIISKSRNALRPQFDG